MYGEMSFTNFPVQLPSFIGREREIAEIQRLLFTSHLVTLISAGGSGKTRLVIQIAGVVSETFAHGVWMVDPAGYVARDFPGETFRVLKEKEIRQYGEYRTRRLVLEAWERLEGNGEWRVATSENPPAADQPPLADFGLYKCGACGKMVMGFDRENNAREAHTGKSVEWRKVK